MAQSQYMLYSSIPRTGDNVITLFPAVQTVPTNNHVTVDQSAGYEQQTQALCKVFQPISFQEALSVYGSYQHVADNMYYARHHQLINGRHHQPASILMIFREDGQFGFPGGHIERSDSSILDGLNRELREEINIKQKYEVIITDYVASVVCHEYQRVFHLFAHEVSADDLTQIEKRSSGAAQWGNEIFGMVRVPLYVMEDGFHGLPAFLSNLFVHDARNHLIRGIRQRQLIPSAQLNAIIQTSDEYLRTRR